MKKILLLGATGSIGTSTLKVIRKYPKMFKLVGATAYSSREKLLSIMDEFGAKHGALKSENSVFTGKREEKASKDVNELFAEELDYDIVVNGLVGSVGFMPTLRAIETDRTVALANKETIVAYGQIIKKALEKHPKASIRPVDSEHSALWQLLERVDRREVEKCYITASGGVVYKTKRENLTLKEVLNHPVWSMGRKVTVDSSTMVNKGLEVIEAFYLFNLKIDQIAVMIHPQSFIHAALLLKDGTYISHMAIPDMVLPISYALFYPDRPKESLIMPIKEGREHRFDLFPIEKKNHASIYLAYCALEKESTYPAVYNAANEGAVALFLQEKIKFTDIVRIIGRVMKEHSPEKRVSIASIRRSEEWARKRAMEIGENL